MLRIKRFQNIAVVCKVEYCLQEIIIKKQGGAYGITVIVVGLGYPSSNPGQTCFFQSANTSMKSVHPTILRPSMGKL